MRAELRILCKQLDYSFKDEKLLEIALTHRSAAGLNNERLEYLGDGALNFIVAEELYRRYIKASEGDLSRLRASLVNGATLAALAKTLELGNYLRLGQGELKSGGFRRESILAGAFEALIGAVYLDGGFENCRRLVMAIYKQRLEDLSPEITKDPKTRLQEYLQARKLPLPHYVVKAISGEEHSQVFTVECTVTGINKVAVGIGHSRRVAEQNAAAQAFQFLTEVSSAR